MLAAVFARGYAALADERAREVALVEKAGCGRDVRYEVVGFFKKSARGVEADCRDVVPWRCGERLGGDVLEAAFRHFNERGQFLEGQFPRVVLGNERRNLAHAPVSVRLPRRILG